MYSCVSYALSAQVDRHRVVKRPVSNGQTTVGYVHLLCRSLQTLTNLATADRAPDQLPTTTTGEPVATVTPGPPSGFEDEQTEAAARQGSEAPGRRRVPSVRFAHAMPPGDEPEEDEWDFSDEEDPDGMDVDDPHPSSLRI